MLPPAHARVHARGQRRGARAAPRLPQLGHDGRHPVPASPRRARRRHGPAAAGRQQVGVGSWVRGGGDDGSGACPPGACSSVFTPAAQLQLPPVATPALARNRLAGSCGRGRWWTFGWTCTCPARTPPRAWCRPWPSCSLLTAAPPPEPAPRSGCTAAGAAFGARLGSAGGPGTGHATPARAAAAMAWQAPNPAAALLPPSTPAGRSCWRRTAGRGCCATPTPCACRCSPATARRPGRRLCASRWSSRCGRRERGWCWGSHGPRVGGAAAGRGRVLLPAQFKTALAGPFPSSPCKPPPRP